MNRDKKIHLYAPLERYSKELLAFIALTREDFDLIYLFAESCGYVQVLLLEKTSASEQNAGAKVSTVLPKVLS